MSLTDAALQLVEAGWPVFPVSAETKRPRTIHGHLDATTDASLVRFWSWAFDEGGAIATPTGNGLLVIDVDPRNGGRPPHWLPPTLTARTQSGGLHFYYRIDEDIKSRAGLFGPGVDSKGRGGYVLMPPSPGYEWAETRPIASLNSAIVLSYAVPESRERSGQARLAPDRWRRGIIHDQVLAWAAYFASQLDDEDDVAQATWDMVDRAREAGVRIDNARGHIDTAIQWVLQREGAKDGTAPIALG